MKEGVLPKRRENVADEITKLISILRITVRRCTDFLRKRPEVIFKQNMSILVGFESNIRMK
jgi:hypothetical protein